MDKQDALKLRNGDEIVEKRTGMVWKVCCTPWEEAGLVRIEAVHDGSYFVFDHKEVR
jgi:hypothetical protein